MSKKFTDNNAVEKLIQKQKWGLLWQTSGKTSPSMAGGASLLPAWGAKIPHASWTEKPNIKVEAML